MALAVLASATLTASATTIGSFNWTRQTGYYAGSGGEFTAYNLTGIDNSAYGTPAKNIGNPDPSFQTFCLELKENAANPSYFVVGSAATRGGTVASSDPISEGTAWLYSQFAKGVLNVTLDGAGNGNYFGGTRPSEAAALQTAIWALEGETGAPSDNAYYTAALANGGTASASAGYLGVYVLINFTSAAARDAFVSSGTFDPAAKAQDFLWMPDNGTTMLLLGAGIFAVGLARRRLS